MTRLAGKPDRSGEDRATLDLTDRALAVRAAGPPNGPGSPAAAGAVDLAAELAEDLLGEDRQRWRHTQAVAARAAEAAGVVPSQDVTALLAAAWLHDIGYAPALRGSGFHPLDGAGYLSELGWPPLVAGLVAHHSGARFVAEVRGLGEQLGRYDDPVLLSGPLADALTWADQTTGPTGQTVDVHTRLSEMLHRHGQDSPNARAYPRRAPQILRAVAATDDALLLRGAGRRLLRPTSRR